jgi:type II secretory pathway pseudopilin PulG
MKALSNQAVGAGGFSLIEALVVVALMLVLTTMMFGFSSSRRQKSQKALCQDNLQKIYLSLELYGKDFDGQLPFATHAETAEQPLDTLVPRYSADNNLFICPGGRDAALPPGSSLRQGKISYAYYMGRKLDDAQPADEWPLISDRQVNTAAKQKGEPLYSETGDPPGNNHHKFGGNILMGDGTVLDSGPRSPCALAIPTGVVLLNPKP